MLLLLLQCLVCALYWSSSRWKKSQRTRIYTCVPASDKLEKTTRRAGKNTGEYTLRKCSSRPLTPLLLLFNVHLSMYYVCIRVMETALKSHPVTGRERARTRNQRPDAFGFAQVQVREGKLLFCSLKLLCSCDR